MLRCVFCLLASFFIFGLVSVFAQESNSSDQSSRKKIIYREKSYYDFEDTLIRGDKMGPDGSSINRKQNTKFRSSLNLSKSHLHSLRESAPDAR
ncbi:MAG: hypothetical protein ACO3LE_10830 [Bdellovibrionota bacterium]